MTLEPLDSPTELNESTSPADFPVRGWWRVLYGLFVAVIPSFSFLMVDVIKPEWQSGCLQAYLALLLTPEASLIFLFLLAYSIICYLSLLFAPLRFASSFLVRLGIYSGAVLAFQYSIILFVYLFDNKFIYAIFLLWLLPLYFPPVYRWAVRRWGARLTGILLWILIVFGLVVGILAAQEFLFIVIIGLVIAGPFWSLLIALQATLWLIHSNEATLLLPRGLGITAWFAAYFAGWRYDILKMYELYAALPPQPPNCYIATAAANGHPHFVGSKTIQLASGKSMRVNRQLQVLKCAELALMAVAPLAHKLLRKTYDTIGKLLARMIRHPLMADASFVLLKPFEWVSVLLLSCLVSEIDSISIYN